jgi:hypothetical protein
MFFAASIFLRSRHFVSSVLDRLDDVLVASASTQVSRNSPPNFLLAGVRILFQKRARRQDHARRAETALKPVLFLKSFLQRMKFAVIGHAFDGADFATIRLHGKYGTGFHRLTIQQYRAGTAAGGIAANMCSGKRQHITDEMDQKKSRFYLSLAIPAIHFDADKFFGGHKSLFDWNLIFG